MPNCIVCKRECSGDLSNFRDKKTGHDVKDELHKYGLEDLIYENPVCLEHYELTRDDFGWLTGTGYYAQ